MGYAATDVYASAYASAYPLRISTHAVCLTIAFSCRRYMYPWQHPKRIFCKVILAFAAIVAALSLPGLLVTLLGDLYSTAWFVPVASTGMGTWRGGLGDAQR